MTNPDVPECPDCHRKHWPFYGCFRTVEAEREDRCLDCDGAGLVEGEGDNPLECSTCHGTGRAR